MSEESRATNSLSRLTKWFGTIICVLVAAGVIGIFAMAKEQAVISTTVIYIKERLDGLDNRLLAVENSQRGYGGYVR